MDDAHAVYEVMARQEQHDLGKVEIEPADIVGDWQKPSFDVEASTLGVLDGETLVAYAEVNKSGRGDAAVDPTYRHRGIGTTLAGLDADPHRRAGRHRDRLAGPRGLRRRPPPREARLARALDQLGAAPPRGSPRSRIAPCPRGTGSGRPPRRTIRPPTRSRRTPSSSGPSASASRIDDFLATTRPASRLRAVALPRGDRRLGRDRRHRADPASTASHRSRPSSAGSPYAATSGTGDSPRPCSSTRSPVAASTARTRSALSTDSRTGRSDPLPEGGHGGRRRLGEPRQRGVNRLPSQRQRGRRDGRWWVKRRKTTR